jgi:hypothetical protein
MSGIGQALLDDFTLSVDDKQLCTLSHVLRVTADNPDHTLVKLHMTPVAARRLAYDLEELAMLRGAPPTGDEG